MDGSSEHNAHVCRETGDFLSWMDLFISTAVVEFEELKETENLLYVQKVVTHFT